MDFMMTKNRMAARVALALAAGAALAGCVPVALVGGAVTRAVCVGGAVWLVRSSAPPRAVWQAMQSPARAR